MFPVARFAPQTCRLRLVLHHFLLLGACDKHFLEVDGRRLCGCQSRGQLHAYFRSAYYHPLQQITVISVKCLWSME